MTCIVTSTYRYKRPPRKRKVVALEGPAVVTAKSSRRPVWGKTAAEVIMLLAPSGEGGAAQPSTPREAARVVPPANDDRREATSPHRGEKSAIVTIKRKSRFGDAPDMTPEEHQRRGDAADAVFREIVRRVRKPT